MQSSQDLPAMPKADPEPPSNGTVKIEREIGHVVMWVWARWAVITAIGGGLVWAVNFGFGKVSDSIDRKIDPIKAAIEPVKKVDDHEKRITVVETKINGMSHQVDAIYRHLLKGEPMKHD